MKSFHSFKYAIDHGNTCFFFLIFLSTIFAFLFLTQVVQTALCDSFYTTCCIFSTPVPWQLSGCFKIQENVFKGNLRTFKERIFLGIFFSPGAFMGLIYPPICPKFFGYFTTYHTYDTIDNINFVYLLYPVILERFEIIHTVDPDI